MNSRQYPVENRQQKTTKSFQSQQKQSHQPVPTNNYQIKQETFNFDAGILTIHDGKGKKDRTVPIPQSIVAELKTQLQNTTQIYEADMKVNFAGNIINWLNAAAGQ